MRVVMLIALALGGCGGEATRAPATGGGGGDDVPRSERTSCTKIEFVEGPGGRFAVFAFEASRPNATATSGGEGEALPACSEEGLIPWTNVTWDQADAACQASGWRLCTEDEWSLACGGTDRQPLPYGQIHRPGWCNDHQGGVGELESGGVRDKCVSPVGAYDIIGNAWEWVADPGGEYYRGSRFLGNGAPHRGR